MQGVILCIQYYLINCFKDNCRETVKIFAKIFLKIYIFFSNSCHRQLVLCVLLLVLLVLALSFQASYSNFHVVNVANVVVVIFDVVIAVITQLQNMY